MAGLQPLPRPHPDAGGVGTPSRPHPNRPPGRSLARRRSPAGTPPYPLQRHAVEGNRRVGGEPRHRPAGGRRTRDAGLRGRHPPRRRPPRLSGAPLHLDPRGRERQPRRIGIPRFRPAARRHGTGRGRGARAPGDVRRRDRPQEPAGLDPPHAELLRLQLPAVRARPPSDDDRPDHRDGVHDQRAGPHHHPGGAGEGGPRHRGRDQGVFGHGAAGPADHGPGGRPARRRLARAPEGVGYPPTRTPKPARADRLRAMAPSDAGSQ